MKIDRKGFTLIELLIVIAIIGILAGAFLPSLLGAPARSRDTSRVADLRTVGDVLVNENLKGVTIPATGAGCVNSTVFGSTLFDQVVAAFGGRTPADPASDTALTVGGNACGTEYAYIKNPGDSNKYRFGLYTKLEDESAANTLCENLDANTAGKTDTLDLTTGFDPDTSTYCYALLIQ